MNDIEDNIDEKINTDYLIEQMKNILSKIKSGEVIVESAYTQYEIGHDMWDATFTLKFKKRML